MPHDSVTGYPSIDARRFSYLVLFLLFLRIYFSRFLPLAFVRSSATYLSLSLTFYSPSPGPLNVGVYLNMRSAYFTDESGEEEAIGDRVKLGSTSSPGYKQYET